MWCSLFCGTNHLFFVCAALLSGCLLVWEDKLLEYSLPARRSGGAILEIAILFDDSK